VTIAVLWITVVYNLLVTSATELGENMRFHFELGTLPAVLAAVTITSLLGHGRRDASPTEPEATACLETVGK
jgi:hypothetical protein